MAKNQPIKKEPSKLIKRTEDFKQQIENRIDEGTEILKKEIKNINDFDDLKRKFSAWNDYNSELLKQAFNRPDNEYRYQYDKAGVLSIRVFTVGHQTSFREEINEFVQKFNSKIDNLTKLKNKIELIPNEVENNDINQISITAKKEIKNKKIFIGHGRSKLYARLQLFLKEDLNIDSFTFESESRTGESIIQILEEFLENSNFAILILTAEDETLEGKLRARQNVIHECGLFQGKLGFNNVVLLKQHETEELTNLAGLQYISFSGDNIEQTFYEIQRKLKKSGIIS
ncbi:putative nucleotide-binding protein [Chryseobacterium sp. SLBN-27]|uniref:nucleotide-binding protein n=1 Tax=Chryseobacterium sp. SLBN-27 TaxID=3042287 RepID=UPI00285A97DE|nr:nucleotide-binding protein [Chryseobacterium sp. SLBN-27]MDR6158620.1 putative nucleotide-binding protein [Chryseobacterium sp. SLBN-27]